MKHRAWTKKDDETFLKILAKTGNVTLASKKIKRARSHAYRRRETDADFARAWDEAEKEAADNLEAEAYRRGVTGVLEAVYQGGKKVGAIRKYSDRCLLTLIRARHPAYRQPDNLHVEARADAEGGISLNIRKQVISDLLNEIDEGGREFPSGEG